MSDIGQKETLTQQKAVAFFTRTLGYKYLGHWKDRATNSNIDEGRLTNWLKRQGHGDKVIGRVLYELGKAKAISGTKTLYEANREVYGKLRYGVKVSPDAGEHKVTVWLIDWENPENNDFAIAEEVALAGLHDKRPDIVLYTTASRWACSS